MSYNLEIQLKDREQEWTDTIESMVQVVYLINMDNGWFDEGRNFGDDIALLHSEVSEMFEAYRKGNPNPKEKDSVEDEAADILIRLLDTCMRHNINLTRQFIQKCIQNSQRGYRHGNKVV